MTRYFLAVIGDWVPRSLDDITLVTQEYLVSNNDN